MRAIETTDIVFAAYLKVKGCELDSIKRVGNKGTFFFTDVEDSLVQDYNLSKALVNPIDFNSAIRQLTTAVRRTQ